MARESYNTKTRDAIKEEIKYISDGYTIKELKEILEL